MPLRLVLFLHRRLVSHVIAADDDPPSQSMLDGSRRLCEGVDELVSGLYAPQQVDEVEDALQEVVKEAKGLWAVAVERMERIADGEEKGKAATELRWLGLWEKQMAKASVQT